LGESASSQPLVEAARADVPVEDCPLDAAASFPPRDIGQFAEEPFAEAAPARVGPDEKVLDVEGRPREERAVGEKVERVGRDRAVELGEEDSKVRAPPKAVPGEAAEGGGIGGRQLFELGELPDEGHDRREVPSRGGSDARRHRRRLQAYRNCWA
jgi:hypothetical protein